VTRCSTPTPSQFKFRYESRWIFGAVLDVERGRRFHYEGGGVCWLAKIAVSLNARGFEAQGFVIGYWEQVLRFCAV
jgi:hypothetical protein